MSVIRVNKNKNFVTMSNYHFKEKEMSLKAKGLLSEMLSLPDNWDYSVAGLVAINKENETSIKSTLEELKKFGYLKVTKLLPNETKTGRIEYIYDIYEKKQEGEKQGVENLGVEFLGVENQGQYNINNKIINNKKNNIIYYANKELNDLFKDFLELRKKIKAVNSERAIKMLINKLSKYEDNVKIKMLERSILNSWKDVYELPKEKYKEPEPSWLNQEIKERDELTDEEREWLQSIK